MFLADSRYSDLTPAPSIVVRELLYLPQKAEIC